MNKAFTLIELMIAISIFFTLSYLSYVSIENAFALSADVKAEEDYTTDVIRVISRIKLIIIKGFGFRIYLCILPVILRSLSIMYNT